MCEVPAIASHGFCVFIDGNSKERQEIWMVVTTVSAILGVFLFVFLHGVIFYAFQSFYSFYYSFS